MFRVSLHSAISGRSLQTVVDATGTGKDTSFLQDDPRVSYLVIESRNLDWTATLEEAVHGASSPASDLVVVSGESVVAETQVQPVLAGRDNGAAPTVSVKTLH
jgi:hypothetical protein